MPKTLTFPNGWNKYALNFCVPFFFCCCCANCRAEAHVSVCWPNQIRNTENIQKKKKQTNNNQQPTNIQRRDNKKMSEQKNIFFLISHENCTWGGFNPHRLLFYFRSIGFISCLYLLNLYYFLR